MFKLQDFVFFCPNLQLSKSQKSQNSKNKQTHSNSVVVTLQVGFVDVTKPQISLGCFLTILIVDCFVFSQTAESAHLSLKPLRSVEYCIFVELNRIKMDFGLK